MSKQVIELTEQSDYEDKKTTKVTVEARGGTICITPEGYGVACMDGDSDCIYIEQWEGKLFVRCWADINQEDPTHKIDMEEARLTARWEIDDEGNCPYCGQECFTGQGCDEQLAQKEKA